MGKKKRKAENSGRKRDLWESEKDIQVEEVTTARKSGSEKPRRGHQSGHSSLYNVDPKDISRKSMRGKTRVPTRLVSEQDLLELGYSPNIEVCELLRRLL